MPEEETGVNFEANLGYMARLSLTKKKQKQNRLGMQLPEESTHLHPGGPGFQQIRRASWATYRLLGQPGLHGTCLTVASPDCVPRASLTDT